LASGFASALWVKSEGVERWAGLWMRIDGDSKIPKQLAFDNNHGVAEL
jgi:hypothetical protein